MGRAVNSKRRDRGFSGNRSAANQNLTPGSDQLLNDLDEVVQGRGDGLLAVSRVKLEAVEDVVFLPFNHLTMLTDAPIPVEKQLRGEILKRLTHPSHPGR